ncbi:hypothetical protein Btru_042127 [Bulinus truncatus]|nr:hypothetical protein Btru_042127 [Bulinus truncatus]
MESGICMPTYPCSFNSSGALDVAWTERVLLMGTLYRPPATCQLRLYAFPLAIWYILEIYRGASAASRLAWQHDRPESGRSSPENLVFAHAIINAILIPPKSEVAPLPHWVVTTRTEALSQHMHERIASHAFCLYGSMLSRDTNHQQPRQRTTMASTQD